MCFSMSYPHFVILFGNIIPWYPRYEKLQRWDDALKAYTLKATQATAPHIILDATLGWILALIVLF